MDPAADRRRTTVDVWSADGRLQRAGAVVTVEGPPRPSPGAVTNPVVPVRFASGATALVPELLLRRLPHEGAPRA